MQRKTRIVGRGMHSVCIDLSHGLWLPIQLEGPRILLSTAVKQCRDQFLAQSSIFLVLNFIRTVTLCFTCLIYFPRIGTISHWVVEPAPTAAGIMLQSTSGVPKRRRGRVDTKRLCGRMVKVVETANRGAQWGASWTCQSST
eukprot:250652-Prorocentrum_minimum.AAC.2